MSASDSRNPRASGRGAVNGNKMIMREVDQLIDLVDNGAPPSAEYLADAEALWLHVDAAYGGFFALTERGRRRLSGIEQADSVTVDAHKGLFLPYGVGALVVRDPGADGRRRVDRLLSEEETSFKGRFYQVDGAALHLRGQAPGDGFHLRQFSQCDRSDQGSPRSRHAHHRPDRFPVPDPVFRRTSRGCAPLTRQRGSPARGRLATHRNPRHRAGRDAG